MEGILNFQSAPNTQGKFFKNPVFPVTQPTLIFGAYPNFLWHFWTNTVKVKTSPLYNLCKKFWKSKKNYQPIDPNFFKHVTGNTGFFLLCPI
jgi:hypothetical protein